MKFNASTVLFSTEASLPVCAIYSTISVVSMQYAVNFNGVVKQIENISRPQATNNGIYFMSTAGSLQEILAPYADVCIITTEWERLEINYDVTIDGK